MSFYEDPFKAKSTYGPHREATQVRRDYPRKIAAIKAAREASGIGLKEAKDAVEAVLDSIADAGMYIVGGGTPTPKPEPKRPYEVLPHEVAFPPKVPDTEPLALTDDEYKAARKVIAQAHANMDVKLQEVLKAINHVRENDDVGTLRKGKAGVHAFSYAPGKWLLIDTENDEPRYRTLDTAEANRDVRDNWELVSGG